MRKIFDHTRIQYRNRWNIAGKNKYNGAYYYSKEIVANIIPNVKTDRNWMTVNIPRMGADHSIAFVHNNLHPEIYDWLKMFNDVVLVCGVPETVGKMKERGFKNVIYLPLSIDVKYVEKFKRKQKTKKVAFAGRPGKHSNNYDVDLPAGIDYLEGLPRDRMLQLMANYKQIFAVGRTAVEAKALGCEVLPYDARFPDPDIWEVIDNKEAAKILQKELDKIDKKETDKATELEDPEDAIIIPTMDNTKKVMLAWCEEQGLKDVTSKMTKADIMEKIRESLA